jgi:hypothetical protein
MFGHHPQDAAFVGNRDLFERIGQRKPFDKKGMLQAPLLLFVQVEFQLKGIQKTNVSFHETPLLKGYPKRILENASRSERCADVSSIGGKSKRYR